MTRKCLKKNCPNDAVMGSNYCESHQLTIKTVRKRYDDETMGKGKTGEGFLNT